MYTLRTTLMRLFWSWDLEHFIYIRSMRENRLYIMVGENGNSIGHKMWRFHLLAMSRKSQGSML